MLDRIRASIAQFQQELIGHVREAVSALQDKFRHRYEVRQWESQMQYIQYTRAPLAVKELRWTLREEPFTEVHAYGSSSHNATAYSSQTPATVDSWHRRTVGSPNPKESEASTVGS